MAFKNFQKSSHVPMSEINTTPLVDVMLVLLIIFIVTAPLITNSIKIDLPATESTVSAEPIESIKISIDAEGQVYLGAEKIQTNKLAQLLQKMTKDQNIEKTEVHLQIDQKTQYYKIAEIMTEIKKTGITHLGFINKVK